MRALLAPSAGRRRATAASTRPLRGGGEWLSAASDSWSRSSCSRSTSWPNGLGHRAARHQPARRPARAAADLQLHLHQNEGISLGLLNATNPVGRWMLVALTSAIAVGRRGVDRQGEEPRSTRSRSAWCSAARSATSSTACGTAIVTDFLDLHFGEFRPFLVFNVGDAAISIAVVILLLRAFLTRKDHAKGQARGDYRTCVKALPPSSLSPPSRPAAAPPCADAATRRDEFTVARSAPLIVPPDFNLAPPVTGTRRPVAVGRSAAGDRHLVRRPRAAQPGRNEPARPGQPRHGARSASARPCGTRIRASSTRARRRSASFPRRASNSNVASAQAGQ